MLHTYVCISVLVFSLTEPPALLLYHGTMAPYNFYYSKFSTQDGVPYTTEHGHTTVILFTPSCSNSRCNLQVQGEAAGSLIFAMAVRCRGHAPGEFIIIFTCGACQCTVTTCNYRAPSRRRRWRWQRVKSPSTAAAFLCIVWVSVWWMHINTYIHLAMHECLLQCTCIWLIYLSGPGSIGFVSALAAANTIDNSLEAGIPHLDYAPSLVPCPFPACA